MTSHPARGGRQSRPDEPDGVPPGVGSRAASYVPRLGQEAGGLLQTHVGGGQERAAEKGAARGGRGMARARARGEEEG